MYMTRDKDDEGMIAFWNSDKLLGIFHKIWSSDKVKMIFDITPKDFKQQFPKQKLPRKGSCKYVELRLYIPGEG